MRVVGVAKESYLCRSLVRIVGVAVLIGLVT